MEASTDVVIALQGVRPTMRLVHNPQGKLVGGRSFDVNGKPREKLWQPRWELWDTDADGVEYKVTTLEDENGEFRHPDQRLVELIRLINPERYGGDLHKMVEALVDEPNNYVEGLSDKSYEELVESVADRCWSAKTPHIAVPRTIVPARLG